MAMMLKMGECLLLSRLLLTRSVPTCQNKPILLSLIRLPQLFLPLAGVGASIPQLLLGGINHFLQQIRRCPKLSFLHTANPIVRWI
jgi:hypothetical protein